MSQEPIPQWAMDEAYKRARQEFSWSVDYAVDSFALKDAGAMTALARLIATHEPAPVDPLVEEMRRVVAENHDISGSLDGHRASYIAAGEGDSFWEAKVVLAALRRGMELAAEMAGAGK